MMTGIMSAVEAKNQSLLAELRAGLAKRSASSNPEQILQAMSEAERQAVLAMAMQVQRAMLYGNANAADVLQHHYPNTAQDRRQLSCHSKCRGRGGSRRCCAECQHG